MSGRSYLLDLFGRTCLFQVLKTRVSEGYGGFLALGTRPSISREASNGVIGAPFGTRPIPLRKGALLRRALSSSALVVGVLAKGGLVEGVAEVVNEVGRVVLVLRLVVAPPRCLEQVAQPKRRSKWAYAAGASSKYGCPRVVPPRKIAEGGCPPLALTWKARPCSPVCRVSFRRRRRRRSRLAREVCPIGAT